MLISVIVPVYNVAPYLPKCLDSILAQTHRELEIILIDDGSADSSGTICDEYAQKDQRIQVIHKTNGGLSSARNAGLDIATGAYIAFIDSDDFIMPRMFSAMLTTMTRENADMAICGIKRVDESNRQIFWGDQNFWDSCPIKNDVMDNWHALRILFQSAWYQTTCNKLYKRALFQDIRFPLGRFHEDGFVIHHLLDKCHKVVTLEEKFYLYTWRRENLTSINSEKRFVDQWNASYDRYLFFKRKGKGFGYCRNRSVQDMQWVLMEFFKKLDLAEHQKVITPLYRKTFWLLVKYGDLRAGRLFLYWHNPTLAQRLIAFIEPLIRHYRRHGKATARVK